jgi:hypothetical protein
MQRARCRSSAVRGVSLKGSRQQCFQDGGAEGIRTPDPHNAIVVLYQLSYDPIRE